MNVLTPVELVIAQVDGHFKITLISQVIKVISRVLQKLLKYFDGTAILTSFVLPSAGILPVIFILGLNNSESTKLAFGSLKYGHKHKGIFE